MSNETVKVRPTEWERQVIWRRNAQCPRCGYMAVESYQEGSDFGAGVCTKCQNVWDVETPGDGAP